MKLSPNYFDETSTTNISETPAQKLASETKDWKTYTNATYGISFKYPSTWSAKDYGTNEAGLYSSTNINKDASGVVQPNIIVSGETQLAAFISDNFAPSNNSTTLKDAVRTGCNVSDIDSQKIALVGHTAYWAYYDDAVTIFIDMGNNNVSTITYWDSSVKTYNDIPTEMRTIFSTLQFTK